MTWLDYTHSLEASQGTSKGENLYSFLASFALFLYIYLRNYTLYAKIHEHRLNYSPVIKTQCKTTPLHKNKIRTQKIFRTPSYKLSDSRENFGKVRAPLSA